MMLPKVSIIVPVYNAEKYLATCVDSVLSQSFKDFELLLVDDGSCDSSGVICDSFASKDNRVRVFHISNGGPSRTRNYGLDRAFGKYVLFVDADDWIDKRTLDIIANENTIDLLFFGFKQIKNNSSEKCQIPRSPQHISTNLENTLEMLFTDENQCFGFTWNKFFRREILDTFKVRFCEELRYREDEIFTLQYCKYISSIGLSEECPYNYRLLDDSLSHHVNANPNYLVLANIIEAELGNNMWKTNFFEALINRTFTYYFLAISEDIHSINVSTALYECDRFFHQYQKKITTSYLKKILFSIPAQNVRLFVIESLCKLRLKIHY